MKGFSKSIAYRFQPIWKIKNQIGKGKLNEKSEENIELPSNKFYKPPVNIEKCKKRSKKHKNEDGNITTGNTKAFTIHGRFYWSLCRRSAFKSFNNYFCFISYCKP